ncbi:MAG: hypothetical protein ACI8RZ_003434 [Myxococcota bacterium]|jgi:hypothetical protein
MLLTLLSLSATARSWCAAPLTVHEWGVQVFSADGRPLAGPPLPDWFHTIADGPAHDAQPVAELLADSGLRTLPVLQFYSPRHWESIPVALDIGFALGQPIIWYPQVDAITETSLHWRRLDLLSQAPSSTLPLDEVGWVAPLRAVTDAWWVQRGEEVERFVFYEGATRESPALRLTNGPTADNHHILHNTTDWDVHDVFVVKVQDGQRQVWYAPKVPAGKSAGFLLESDETDPAGLLAQRLTTDRPESWAGTMGEECVMMRDPAVPARQTTGHQLYTEELAVLMGVWEDRLFTAEGTRILYREDAAALDALVPLSVYTDMYHHVVLSRLGLVVVEGVAL